MIWFWVWAVLVVAALAVVVVLGLGLWRRGKALARELGKAGELGNRLSGTGEVPVVPAVVPGVVGDPATLDDARAARADLRERRAARRRGRASAAITRWHEVILRR